MRIEYGLTDLELTSHAGLPAVSDLLRSAGLGQLFGPSAKTIPDQALFTTQIALLALGQTDFEAVTPYRDDPAFGPLLGLERVPSAEILRQRMDRAPADTDAKLHEASLRLLETHGVPAANTHGFVPLDIDTTPMDNSGTRREEVSYTYKGFEGYHPLLAYLGEQGYMLFQELRGGSQHPQNGFIPWLQRMIADARRITDHPLLVRMDAAHDAAETYTTCLDEQAHFICRWNPRGEEAFDWWLSLRADKTHFASGPGYFTALVDQPHRLPDGREVRRIVLVTQRTADGRQLLITPKYELEGICTSLDLPAEEVIALYEAHGTCEQFHSELKSDIGLERFPSWYFNTNARVLSCAEVAFNILRLLGELMLRHGHPPRRLRQRRRSRYRLRSVIDTLLHHAGILVHHARRAVLKLGRRTANALCVLDVLRAAPG